MTDSAGQLRDDAFEFFTAEAARMRLADRRGVVRICLRSGAVLVGQLSPRQVGDCLGIVDNVGHALLVSQAEIVTIRGSRPALRDEQPVERPWTLASQLREQWSTRSRLRVLLPTGEWVEGSIALVAADHVELINASGGCVVPFASVEVWDLGASA